MAAKQIRYVNVVPNAKVKKELPSDNEDEECVQCRVCCKSFASAVALRNHARMEHTQAFATGDPGSWTEPLPKKAKHKPMSPTEQIKQKTENLISSMAPTSLLSLASEDVSYILIKSNEELGVQWDGSRSRKRRSENTEVNVTVARKEEKKEVPPITGPFECLQPSTLVADGTCHQIFFSCCEYSVHFRDEHTRRRKGQRCQVCEKPLLGADGAQEPQTPYNCEVCGMGFEANKELSEHMATNHVKLKPFECKVCHKRFTQQGGVQQHMRMHTGDRPFSCTFCEKSFTQKSGLDQHVRIHTKVKPYRCVVCSKTFCQSVHLKQHMRTHTNVTPFQCAICTKRFTQKSGLEQHARTHSKEKPYSCDVCAKTFSQNPHLRQHLKTHDPSEITCPFCFERFKQSSHLNYHIKNHNTTSMTDEQRVQYKKLIAQITTTSVAESTNEKKFMCVLNKAGNVQLVEMDEDRSEDQETHEEVEEIEETTEEEVPMDETDLAEQSIQEDQLEEGEETFILSDVGSEVWSVKLVENEQCKPVRRTNAS